MSDFSSNPIPKLIEEYVSKIGTDHYSELRDSYSNSCSELRTSSNSQISHHFSRLEEYAAQLDAIRLVFVQQSSASVQSLVASDAFAAMLIVLEAIWNNLPENGTCDNDSELRTAVIQFAKCLSNTGKGTIAKSRLTDFLEILPHIATFLKNLAFAIHEIPPTEHYAAMVPDNEGARQAVERMSDQNVSIRERVTDLFDVLELFVEQ